MTVMSKYGWVAGSKLSVPIEMKASQALKSQSGRFIALNGQYGELAINTTTKLYGFVEEGDVTTGSTDGDSPLNCIIGLDNRFRVPFIYDASTYTQNYADTLIGTAVDIAALVGGKQYVDLAVSTNDLLIVVGGQAASAAILGINDGYVDVIFNPGEMIGRT